MLGPLFLNIWVVLNTGTGWIALCCASLRVQFSILIPDVLRFFQVSTLPLLALLSYHHTHLNRRWQWVYFYTLLRWP